MCVVYTMEVFQMNFFNNKANLRKMCLLNMKIMIRLHFLNEIRLNNVKVLWECKGRVIIATGINTIYVFQAAENLLYTKELTNPLRHKTWQVRRIRNSRFCYLRTGISWSMLRYFNFEPSFKLRRCRKEANSGSPNPPNLLDLVA